MKPVHIVGAGGHGRVVFDLLHRVDPGRPVVWHDDAWKTLQAVDPVDTVRSLDELREVSRAVCFVAIGSPLSRLSLLDELAGMGHEVVTLVHPDATVSVYSTLGVGCVCMARSVVQAGARLGRGVIVNTAATVDHDCVLGDGVHIAPGANLAGDVVIGDRSWIGIGAVVREGTTIGADVTIGAGAVVVGDVEDGATVVGNPARPLTGEQR